MLRLKRHIITEIIEVFFAVIIALILIMVSFQFAKLLSQAASGKIAGTAIFQLVALQAVYLFVLLAPFAFFIAMLIAMTRLANDNELIAMRAVGFSTAHTYQALLTLGIPLAGLILYLTLAVVPEVRNLNYTLLEKAKKESELSIIQPGQFRTIGGNTTIFVADVSDKAFSKFFVWQRQEDVESITVSKAGNQREQDGERYIDLTQGSRYSQNQKDNTSQLFTFERMTALLPTVEAKKRSHRIKGRSTVELLKKPTLSNQAELQRRISPAISILLLVICAPLLVQFNPRENRYGKFAIAILIYAIYTNSQHTFQALILKKSIGVYPGVYSAHLIFAGLIIAWILWRLSIHNRPVKASPNQVFDEPLSEILHNNVPNSKSNPARGEHV